MQTGGSCRPCYARASNALGLSIKSQFSQGGSFDPLAIPVFVGGRVYCTYTGVLLALGLRARARLAGMVSMVCCGGAAAGYSPACAAPVALLLVSQARKDGLTMVLLCCLLG